MKRCMRVSVILALALSISIQASAGQEQNVPFKARLAVSTYNLWLKSHGFDPDDLCVHSIGQSHIDAAWKWRKAQTHTKVYRTYGQAVEHMKKFPEFIFSGSSPQYYEWLLEEHPEVFRQILEMEKKGRWEIVGGQWIEPDGNMPDGESFVRQRLLGQRFYLEHFGHLSEVCWMLDSFGYNYNLPQIMARSGAKYMWTNKLTWNDTTVFPFHNFWWRSPDGSKVLSHICQHSPLPMYFPLQEFNKYKKTRYMLKPGRDLAADYSTRQEEIEEALSDDWSREIGIFYGLGDGGLGPREIEIQIQRGLAAKGWAHFSTVLELFEHIEEDADRYPVWDDEMYLEFHRGVFTTQAWIKRANRRAEEMMRTAEVLRSVMQLFGLEYPYEKMKELWKLVLFQHFHDILPGCSIPEVYEDAMEDYEKIFRGVEEVTREGMEKLAAMIDTRPPGKDMEPFVVFNPLAWDRSGLVKMHLPDAQGYKVVANDGSEPVQQLVTDQGGEKIMFMAKAVPATGYKLYFLKPGEKERVTGPKALDKGGSLFLENEHVRVEVDVETGNLGSVFYKENGKQMIDGLSNKIVAFHDRPKVYSAWNIGHDYLDNPIEIGPPSQVRITRQGPLFAEVSVKRKAKDRGLVTMFEQRIRVVKGDPVVYLDIESDFHMQDALVKVEYDTMIDSNTISADGPYLVVERPTHPSTPAEKAMWELPCHKWVDLSEPGFGLALLNKGKYGFSLTEDGSGYRLSIIKGARYPRANPGAKDVEHRYQSWPIPTGFTDQGHHHIELGLLPHEGGWRSAKLWRKGYEFNTPFEVLLTDAHSGELAPQGSFIRVESDSVYLGAIKRAEDDFDLVMRLVEAAGKRGSARIELGRAIKAGPAVETDLLELDPRPFSARGSEFEVQAGPYEIKTLKMGVQR